MEIPATEYNMVGLRKVWRYKGRLSEA